MKSRNTKVFIIEGSKYQFDSQSFKLYVKHYAKENNIRNVSVFEKISDKVNVTVDAVKQWYYGNNGPSELEMVYIITQLLNINDYLKLMKKFKEEIDVVVLNSLQMESLKRIYDAIIDYLYDFYKTDGFTGALWYEFQNNGLKNPEPFIYDYAEDKVRRISLVVQKEYFYLHNMDVYSEIEEYVENDLYDIFDGKLEYAYRFEAVVDGNPTTEDDYNKALKRLNEIIEKYT